MQTFSTDALRYPVNDSGDGCALARTGKLRKTRGSVAPATYKAGAEAGDFAAHALRLLNTRPMQWPGPIVVDASSVYKT